MRNTKSVLGIIIRKEVVEIVEPSPGDRTQAQRTWFVRTEKDTLLRPWACVRWQSMVGQERGDFAVEKRRPQLVVGRGGDERESGFGNDGRSEYLAAPTDGRRGERDDRGADRREQARDKLRGWVAKVERVGARAWTSHDRARRRTEWD